VFASKFVDDKVVRNSHVLESEVGTFEENWESAWATWAQYVVVVVVVVVVVAVAGAAAAAAVVVVARAFVVVNKRERHWMKQYWLQFERRSLPQQLLPRHKPLHDLSSEPRNIGAELDFRPERAWVGHSSQEVATAWTIEDIVAVAAVVVVVALGVAVVVAVAVAVVGRAAAAAAAEVVSEEKTHDLRCDPKLCSTDLLSESDPGQRPLQELCPFFPMSTVASSRLGKFMIESRIAFG